MKNLEKVNVKTGEWMLNLNANFDALEKQLAETRNTLTQLIKKIKP